MLKIMFYREKSGMTQMKFAEIIGVSQSTVANWENGVRTPNVYVLKKMAEIFGCSIDDLVSDDKDMIDNKKKGAIV